jgi:hypothetical protein
MQFYKVKALLDYMSGINIDEPAFKMNVKLVKDSLIESTCQIHDKSCAILYEQNIKCLDCSIDESYSQIYDVKLMSNEINDLDYLD